MIPSQTEFQFFENKFLQIRMVYTKLEQENI